MRYFLLCEVVAVTAAVALYSDPSHMPRLPGQGLYTDGSPNNKTDFLRVINQRTDAASPDDDEDGYSGDHDRSYAALIFDTFMPKCKTTKACFKKGGECLQGQTCSTIKIKARCGKKCSCCSKPAKRELTSLRMGYRQGTPSLMCYTGSCPGHFDDLGGTCYWFSSNRGLKFSWEKSRKFCQEIGFLLGLDVDLADLSDENNCHSHSLLMQKCAEKGALHAWLGAKDEASEGHWIWAHSGRSLSIMNPLWGPGEPNAGTNGNCMTAWITGSHKRAYFADEPCSREFVFVCQIF